MTAPMTAEKAPTQSPKSTAVAGLVPTPVASIAEAVALIRSTPLEDLKNPEFLEKDLLLRCGLNNEYLDEFPKELYPWCGHGVRSWQYPNQFSRYLVHLSTLKLESYLEVGCRHGGTFIITVEYLKRFQKLKKAVAVDMMDSPIMRDYLAKHDDEKICDYKIMSSRSKEFVEEVASQSYDLTLIDGDHTYKGVLNDFIAVRKTAKYVAFHDVVSSACPGVVKIWAEIKAFQPADNVADFTAQYDDVTKKGWATSPRMFFVGLFVKTVRALQLAPLPHELEARKQRGFLGIGVAKFN